MNNKLYVSVTHGDCYYEGAVAKSVEDSVRAAQKAASCL
jgi:hypothetical protein